MRTIRNALAALAVTAVATAAAAVVTSTPAQAVPATIPLQFTNKTGRGEQVWIYVLGTNLATGQQGWADRNGTFHAWPAGGNPPSAAPDASFAGPGNGQSMDFRIPKFSGRIYFSLGQKIVFRLTTGGLVQPDFANPTDPNQNILFDWSEYTLNDSGLWLNSSQVDQFAIPHAVGVKAPGVSKMTGRIKPGGRNTFFKILRDQPGGWGNLIKTRADGTVLRAVAPGKGIAAGTFPANAMDSYITKAWNTYTNKDLVVTPFSNQPNTKFYGRTSGNTMNFRSSPGGPIVTSFQKPSTDGVFGCYKELDAPNDLVRGPISRTLCAALNRSTLHLNANQPDANNANFYKDVVTNHYSRKVHGQMADGKAYGFAFDDVGAHESLVHDGNPQHAYITLDPFN